MSKLFPSEPQPIQINNLTPSSPEQKYPIWSRFWFNWVVLTVAYLAIFFISGGLHQNGNIFLVGLGAFLGLFVPIGFYTGFIIFFYFLSLFKGNFTNFYYYRQEIVLGILAIIILIITLLKVDGFLKKYSITPITKIFINLLILFVLTLIFDLAIWRSWLSWQILRDMGIQSMAW